MRFFFVVLLLFTIAVHNCLAAETFVSILGDPGMTNPHARFAFEGWNACNEVGEEAPKMGSPRMADCANLICTDLRNKSTCSIFQQVNETANLLKAGDKFPGSSSFNSSAADVDNYAAEKEKYLGSLCQLKYDFVDKEAWYFWMIMLKNGNLDMNNTKICPKYGRKVVNKTEMTWNKTFPCYSNECMNQPLVFRKESRLDATNQAYPSLIGEFYGSHDLLDSGLTINNSAPASNKSYFGVKWQKNKLTRTSSWILSFKLTTSANYPWLSLFLRADAATGSNAGYHYDGRGIMKMKSLPTSPKFNVTMTLDIIQGGGDISQFYLTNIGGCWKNNGHPCNGNVTTDVTRSVQMIINPTTTKTCGIDNLKACPPYHKNTTTGEIIYKNNTKNFPYDAYNLYCAPGNAKLNETEIDKCDPFTNPMQQELVQIRPHTVWGLFGYPTNKDEVGWEGAAGPKTWNLDVGNLTAGIYSYQDPGYKNAATRKWTSIMVGTEMYNLNKSDNGQYTAEWTVSNFDVLVLKKLKTRRR